MEKTDCCAGSFFALILLQCSINGALGTQQVSAVFVFGDSLVDDGNNNYLISFAKANYYPYGIDFYRGPTGRFCNGKTVVDTLCDLMGLAYPPPYSQLNGSRLIGGVNYASAAAGILDESGQFLGDRITLNQQVLNFESNLYELRAVLGANLPQYLAKCIVMVIVGSNDYINSYLLPSLYSTSFNYSPQNYAKLLLNRYTKQIDALHSLGLRKFFLPGVGPLGCIPNQRASGEVPPDRCVDRVNEMVGYFKRGLRLLIDQLNSNYTESIFVYGNTYDALEDILNNPKSYGFTVTDRACCGIGTDRGQITCLELEVPCMDRNEHVFWDAYHPSQAVNFILGKRAFTGSPDECHPMNVQQMAQQ